MANSMWRTAIYLVMCASGLIAFAQEEGAARSPFPADGFQFVGNWDCTGSFASGKAHKATFIGAVILGGKWLELAEQDVEPATGYLAKYLIGYDSQHKGLIEFDANNFGSATYTSDRGWQNGILTVTSSISQDAKAPYMADRFLYSVVNRDEFTVEWQVSKTAVLNWKRADYLVCTRKASGNV